MGNCMRETVFYLAHRARIHIISDQFDQRQYAVVVSPHSPECRQFRRSPALWRVRLLALVQLELARKLYRLPLDTSSLRRMALPFNSERSALPFHWIKP